MSCIFCKIVQGESDAFIVWEDEQHLAFLSIYPNTPGVTVVIPRIHYPSYVFDLGDKTLCNLMLAAKMVAKRLDASLVDVGRTALVFEGFGVDHVHAKLFPMHGTKNMQEWIPIKSNVNKFFDSYEGYISSHDYDRENNEELGE